MSEFVIDKGIFNKVIDNLNISQPSIMSIIGERNGVIVKVSFVSSVADWINNDCDDNKFEIDKVIGNWKNEGINFIGLINRYCSGERWLTSTNIKFAMRLLKMNDELPYVIIGVVGEYNSSGYQSYEFKVYKFLRDGRKRRIRYVLKDNS